MCNLEKIRNLCVEDCFKKGNLKRISMFFLYFLLVKYIKPSLKTCISQIEKCKKSIHMTLFIAPPKVSLRLLKCLSLVYRVNVFLLILICSDTLFLNAIKPQDSGFGVYSFKVPCAIIRFSLILEH